MSYIKMMLGRQHTRGNGESYHTRHASNEVENRRKSKLQ